METVHEIIRKAEHNYLTGTTKLGEHVDWSMHDTIERIDAYLNSRHISGQLDSLGREKPFFNVCSAAVNVWYRATDLDRKDIRFVPKTSSSVLLAFIANVMLQNWMVKHRFGQFLNSWGRSLARYGSAVTKFVEQEGELIPSVIPWNRYIADPVQFDALPRIEKFYKTPAQLRQMQEYDQDVVDALIKARTARTTLDGQQKDSMDEFIELYEVHGELDSRLLDKNPDLNREDKEIKYVQQMHVVSYVAEEGSNEYADFTLYRGREGRDPYQKDDLIEEDGRTLGIGAVEYLFDAQWMQNHTIKNMKDTLDLASKLIFQTADSNFVGRNILSAIETGDVLIHGAEKPLTRLANDKPDISALQNFSQLWTTLGQDITSTPEAIRGSTLPSGTPYSLGAYLGSQANSLFELMTENKGLAIENMMRRFVIPHLRKQLKNKDEVVAILDAAGIEEIDAIYVPFQAIRRYNKRAKDALIKGDIPAAFNRDGEEAAVREELGALGDKRFFRPSELDDRQWDEVFSDFDWDNIRVEVTNEETDKQAVLQTLASLYTTTAATDPVKANIILARIMSETGVFSPIQLGRTTATPNVPQPTSPGPDALGALTASTTQ